ncbi:hypothetical protein RhiirA1_427658 [Rhizophagus irregularis]|uniref:Uncharacterized protein n=1 Tax=Rhizophagus irregularis TaxID=588596 RepID=A0A2N0R5A9_9GLOM|nr:hypothetical protein RhiirA1_427658 [Rhizophagus irregularis]UZO22578.1 hypothetical protein OCT59_014938 [Rhizophagus irregularis]CAB5389895.1 unnamed protein product [Rhizophagus irregularis]
MNEPIFSAVAVYLQGSDSELAKLVSIFFCSEISRTLFSGEHKLSVIFTKNIDVGTNEIGLELVEILC